MPSVLSTKLLSPSQKNLLLNAYLSLTEYNAIQTKALKIPASISEEKYQNVIVTSQTTVEIIKDFKIETCFCVGEKTALKLKSLGFKVEVIAESGIELGKKIIQDYSELSFTFFGSKKRRPELSSALKKANVSLAEVFVYDTIKIPKTFQRDFDAVLCFSPSGVDSFFEGNRDTRAKIICIGSTTAQQAKLYSESVFVSTKTSVESVIVKTVKLLK
ncbi:uroporphyrinogen-III synthase [Psychroflexus lacisalsi]|jgi:uroporphyrinogen-III synthase|uniref:Uroporphyrinogen-III synthase n=1 Tax=Psychroflexus lacisalsi TaxID=503928 RepID=A0ABN1K2W6_9FLAO|nr:uroporphyrinogen-III synthase [Psychroflexus lacisalsi]MBZ9618678.1 uroporphyrinogen-III synthase [Psychroflexus lacisalsi]